MKKRLCLLLTALFMLSITAFAATDALEVGNTTALSGNFMNHIFGNNTADIDVWNLLHGYDMVYWSNEYCNFVFDDQIVSGSSIMRNAETDGRQYIIALQNDLYYSDGTPITAYDYAFAILLSMAPEIRDIGGNVDDSDYITGSAAYRNGETKVLSGVHVKSDTVLQIEVVPEYQPYYYLLGMMNYRPYPISEIAPGCVVADDGNGVYIKDSAEHPFSADMLRETLLNPDNGYVSHPAVCSGPYTLTGYDRDNHRAEFAINPYYKGDRNGDKPSIQNLVYRLADNETVISELENGTLGLFNKAVRRDVIESGMRLENIDFSNYMRSGYTYIACCWEQPAMSHNAVRQAIAYCFDADEFVRSYVGGFGVRVNGYYGIGQWMYQIAAGILEIPSAEEEEADEEELELNEFSMDGIRTYDLNLDAAEQLLIADGWTLNANGDAYDAERDAYRCKDVEGVLVPLDLSLIYPEGNIFGDSVQELLIDNLAKVGIRLTAEPMAFTELLRVYYREVERDVDLIYMGTDFTEVFEPSNRFDPEDAVTAYNNRTACTDEELYELSVEMRMTEPNEVAEYVSEWIEFQERFAEVLPCIPVYSNVYFDFYTEDLQNYEIAPNVTWSNAIVPATLG